MTCLIRMLLLRFTLLLLHLSVCWCQHDCTGVDCPVLDSCIEEVLESGACCASCLQKGCTCEGYQYYDCINAGFKNGKVSEGDSYFVDYGSTECSCPFGGGRISCNFISCPDIPPNCIEVSEPVDSCMQCERIGCVHGRQKYEAGHSFHIDPCQVCHCPHEGGKLMCYPVPDCDLKKDHKPMLAAATKEVTARRRSGYSNRFDQQRFTDHFSSPYHPLPNGKLHLFKQIKEPEDYDYGPTNLPETYPQYLVFPTLSFSSKKVSSMSGGSDQNQGRNSAIQNLDRQAKLELREQYGVHEHSPDKEKVSENPLSNEQSTVRLQMHEDTTTSWQLTQGPTSVQSVSVNDLSLRTDSENPLDAHRSYIQEEEKHPDHMTGEGVTQYQRGSEVKTHHQSTSDNILHRGSHNQISQPVRGAESQTNKHRQSETVNFQLYTVTSPENTIHPQASGQKVLQGSVTPDSDAGLSAKEMEKMVTPQTVTEPEEEDVSFTMQSAQQERSHEDTKSTESRLSTSPTTRSNFQISPSVNVDFITTTAAQPPVRSTLDETELSSKPAQKLFNPHNKDREEVKAEGTEKEEIDQTFSFTRPDESVSSEDMVQSCCAAGHSWATENLHCNNMPTLDNKKRSICSAVQKHCCLSSLMEGQCKYGMTSARGGDTCEVDQEDHCPSDPYQVCCSCCALGLRLHTEGWGCHAHQYLGDPCAYAFLTCCKEKEGLSQMQLKRMQKPSPTAVPRKVFEGKFPKQALSISATDEAAIVVEEHEDVDQCQLYAGQLCQHKCINIWGSYRCECHQGFILQQDRHSCAPVSPDEDNRVREDTPAAVPTKTCTTTTTQSTTTTGHHSIHFNPCAENGHCSQQCMVIAGQARCSCFPGFSLKTDERMCEDVDECMTNKHSCGPHERCLNTVGSFVCKLQITCPEGYQLRNSVCEDVDECALQTHNCGVGFICDNSMGSFLCKPKHKCISGFTQDSRGNCIDINECDSLNEPCSSASNCINTVGSYTCQQKIIRCSHGYHASPDGAKCVDIDECQTGTHHCGLGQICHNLPGSYRCDCQTGYQYDDLNKVCTDVNECWHYPGRLCAQTCENTPGSYHCSCTTGFSLAFDGKNCEDINECDKNPCSQECANIYGSYQCYCREGYYLKEDRHTCEDIDECSQSIGNHCYFKCVNIAGSYQCACPPQGYTMSANGRTCRDIDECTAGSHNCSYGQSCFNLQGSFRCLSFDCPPNYKKVSDTRCERITCSSNSLDCQSSPVRITYYQLSFQTNIIIPAQIFRIGPSPAYPSDHITISISKGNDEGYFKIRKLNSFTGAIYLQRQVRKPKDFLIDVEMKLLRQSTFTSFLARIYIFITSTV
ncbi:fibulin-2 [Echeneis naucrates]|nr:fibulin-2-like [Echeneis naucrates]